MLQSNYLSLCCIVYSFCKFYLYLNVKLYSNVINVKNYFDWKRFNQILIAEIGNSSTERLPLSQPTAVARTAFTKHPLTHQALSY